MQLALEESSKPNDKVTEVDEVKFLVDPNQSAYFENVKLDFIKNVFGNGEFKIITV